MFRIEIILGPYSKIGSIFKLKAGILGSKTEPDNSLFCLTADLSQMSDMVTPFSFVAWVCAARVDPKECN